MTITSLFSSHPFLVSASLFAAAGGFTSPLFEKLFSPGANKSMAKRGFNILVWAAAGIMAYWSYRGNHYMIRDIYAHRLLPSFLRHPTILRRVVEAASLSLFFLPSQMVLVRTGENLIDSKFGYSGLEKSVKLLIPVWIPLHCAALSLLSGQLATLIHLSAWAVLLSATTAYAKR